MENSLLRDFWWSLRLSHIYLLHKLHTDTIGLVPRHCYVCMFVSMSVCIMVQIAKSMMLCIQPTYAGLSLSFYPCIDNRKLIWYLLVDFVFYASISESSFTKFRLQDMMQYPEKSDQWAAILDMTSELFCFPLVGFFRILQNIIKPESGETRLWSYN